MTGTAPGRADGGRRTRGAAAVRSWLGRVTRAWLAVAVAVTATLSVAETASTLRGGVPPHEAVFGVGMLVVQLAGLLLMLARPRAGAVLVVALCCVASVVSAHCPFTVLFSAFLGIGLLSYGGTAAGLAAAAATACGATADALLHADSAMRGGGAASFTVFCVLAFAAGIAMRWREQRERQTRRAERMAYNAEIAHYLHDYTTNDLNDIIMLADLALTQPDDPERRTVERIRTTAIDALKQTRMVIAALEGDGEETGRGAGTDGPLPERRLMELIDEQRELLEAYGFEGSVLVAEHPLANCSDERARMVLRLVRELFANIAQHADADGGYTMTISATPAQLHITLTDRRSPDSVSGMNTGLARYRARIAAMDGTWEAEEGDDWTLAIVIPCDR